MDNESKLVELARKKFEELSKAEEKLLRKMAKGEMADFNSEIEEENKPTNAKKWGKERVLKAEVVAWLCTNAEASELVASRGVFYEARSVKLEICLIGSIFYPSFHDQLSYCRGLIQLMRRCPFWLASF